MRWAVVVVREGYPSSGVALFGIYREYQAAAAAAEKVNQEIDAKLARGKFGAAAYVTDVGPKGKRAAVDFALRGERP